MEPDDIDDLIASISDALQQRPELAAAYVYGSVATGRATPLSDIDIALVASDDLRPGRRATLLRELVTALGRLRPGLTFDVRFLDELPVSIRGRAVTDGRRVLDRDPARRVEAEVRARMDYHDFLVFECAGAREGLRGLRKAVRDG